MRRASFIIGIISAGLLPLAASAHGLLADIEEQETQQYRVTFSTRPDYPALFKETHFEVQISDPETGAPVSGAEVQLALRTIFPREWESDDGAYDIRYHSHPTQLLPGRESALVFEILDRVSLEPATKKQVSLVIDGKTLEAQSDGFGLYRFRGTFEDDGLFEPELFIGGERALPNSHIFEKDFRIVRDFEIAVGRERDRAEESVFLALALAEEEGHEHAEEGAEPEPEHEHEKHEHAQTADGPGTGHYRASRRFFDSGTYEVTLTLNGEQLPFRFEKDIAGFGGKGVFISLVLFAIFLWAGEKTRQLLAKAKGIHPDLPAIRRSLPVRAVFWNIRLILGGLLIAGVLIEDELSLAVVSIFLYASFFGLIFAIIGGWLGAVLEEDSMPCMDMGALSGIFSFYWSYISVLLGAAFTVLILLLHWTAPLVLVSLLALWGRNIMKRIQENRLAILFIRTNQFWTHHLEMKYRIIYLFGFLAASTTSMLLIGPVFLKTGVITLETTVSMLHVMMGGASGTMLGGWIAGAIIDKHQGCPMMENQIMTGGMAFMAAMMGSMAAAMGGMFAVGGFAGFTFLSLLIILLLTLFYRVMLRNKYAILVVRPPASS